MNFLPPSVASMRTVCVLQKKTDQECAICLKCLNNTEKKKYVTQLPCLHRFHPGCIKRWKAMTCPLCRYSYFFTEYHSVDPYIDGVYRRTQARPFRSIVNSYPYNCRYKRSFYNVVLYELRRFQYYIGYFTPSDALSLIHI